MRIASALIDAVGFCLGSVALLLLLVHLAGVAFLNARGRRSAGRILFGLTVVDPELQGFLSTQPASHSRPLGYGVGLKSHLEDR